MKNQFIYAFLSCLLPLSFFPACTDFVDDVNLPQPIPELVIHGYLFPGMDTIDVHVQTTHPVFSGETDYDNLVLEDATVYIEAPNGDSFLMEYMPQKKRYILPASQLQIHEGEKYHLRVEHPDFPVATAHATIPMVHYGFELVKLDSSITTYSKTYYVETFIHDMPGVENYYILYGYLSGENTVLDEEGEEYTEPFSRRVFPYDELISDKLLDGSSIPKNSSVYMGKNHMPKNLRFTLFSIDRHYYDYRQSILSLDNLDIDPFATPVQLYSNIDNAHGIFSGYSIYEVEFDLMENPPILNP